MSIAGRCDNVRKKIGEIHLAGESLTFWESVSCPDPEWDNFLFSTGFEHFEQTSLWGEAKKPEGWKTGRIIAIRNNQIVGGFQILYKEKLKFLKFGLLMKGPVIASDDFIVMKSILNYLKIFIRHKFFAVLVQAPDREDRITSELRQIGFRPNFIKWIIKSANVRINLNLSEDQLFKKMKRQKRQNIQQAQNAGIVVRQGSRGELGLFFKLMNTTCQRRGVRPNPSSLRTLEKIWDLFSIRGKIALFFARLNDIIISALIVIIMGEHVSLWKFGWSGEYPHLRPNELLFWEIIKWAKSAGCISADLGPFGTYLLKRGKIYDARENYLEMQDVRFKTGFGGMIVNLQPGLIHFSNPLINFLARTIMPYLANYSLTEKIFYKFIGST
ncbi:MAG: peptidoglycan bridge formation glycyltransferase FemA/FemB family protein [Candidatus Saccharicenans sp.]|nr:peptidoglycan bridge formation glycyltransferase FemA/FemB family protein [Candidatus Saccharicenans sp.]MDI6848915.1 peptidoglycan bridge formation glycyltransferase FemA/FemB family protein [Candidatus Saccharicenans sp.]